MNNQKKKKNIAVVFHSFSVQKICTIPILSINARVTEVAWSSNLHSASLYSQNIYIFFFFSQNRVFFFFLNFIFKVFYVYYCAPTGPGVKVEEEKNAPATRVPVVGHHSGVNNARPCCPAPSHCGA